MTSRLKQRFFLIKLRCHVNLETTMTTYQQSPVIQGRPKTFEDIGVRFLRDNVGKIYLFLIALSVLVVAVQEQLI
jgi:hypothetical protein